MTDTPHDHATALALHGELTIFTAEATKTLLIDAVRQGGPADLDIDLADVTEIDTAGLQLMVLAKREAATLGRTVHYANHSAAVLDLIDLTGLAGFFGDPLLIRSHA